MSNYTISVNWSGKDALSDSDPAKVISGSDFNTEFTAVQTAVNTKANLNGAASESFSSDNITVDGDATVGGTLAITGVATGPTPTTGDDSTKLATTAFVQDASPDLSVKADLAGSASQTFNVDTPTAGDHATTKDYVDGTSSIAETGYQILPSGLIMQWGRKSVPNGSNTTVTLPIAFPNDLFTLQGTPNDNRASGDFEVDYYSVACKDTGSLSTFTIMSEGTSSGTMTIFWQALGN